MAETEGVQLHVGEDPPAGALADAWARVRQGPVQHAGTIVFGEIFGRLKPEALLPRVRAAITDWSPDLVIHEAAEFAGPIAAVERGLPHAAVGVSRASTDLLDGAAPALEQMLAGIAAEVRHSLYLTVFPTSLDVEGYPNVRRLRVPVEPAGALPDFWPGHDEPLVYVTFGTVTRETAVGEAAYRTAIAAVSELDARVLLTSGGELSRGIATDLPGNIHLESWIPQGDVFPTAAVVICHGGSGTTVGALAAGVPLVIVPLFADQLDNALAVERVGAGIAVLDRGTRATQRTLEPRDASRIRSAAKTVMDDSSYRDSARRIAAQMKAAPLIDSVWSDLLG